MNVPIQGFDPAWYETGEYGDILRMIRAGVPDSEILKAHPAWPVDVLGVCHKIVNGTLCQLDPEIDKTKRIYCKQRDVMPPKMDLVQEAQRLRDLGLSLRQIAGRLRISATWVRHLLAETDAE